MSGQILDALKRCHYMHEGHLRLFLFMRAILNTALKVGGQRHKLQPTLKQGSVDSVAAFIEDVTMGKVKSGLETLCNDDRALGSADANALVKKFADRNYHDAAAMLLVKIAAISRDNRVYMADSLVDGSDVYLDYSFKTKKWRQTILSKSKLLENPNCVSRADIGGVFDVFKKSNGQGLSGKSHQEGLSAEMVPSTLTTFKILRQHILKHLLGYMALPIIFIVFGEAFNKQKCKWNMKCRISDWLPQWQSSRRAQYPLKLWLRGSELGGTHTEGDRCSFSA